MNAIDNIFATCEERKDDGVDRLFCPSLNMYVRDRGDIGIIREQSLYKDMLKFRKPGLLLDLGAHIGASARYFLDGGVCDKIICVEADPNNFEMLALNWRFDERVIVHSRAVVDDNTQDQVKLYLGKTYTSDNSLEHFRGRREVTVPTIQFYDLLACEPRAIKCDIEGSEYALDWSRVPDSVSEICMELHQFRPAWINAQRVIDDKLLALSFKHVRAPKHDTLFFKKTQIAVWAR